MSMRINTNASSLAASRQAGQIAGARNDSLERIATGKRINSSADDASGMTIASRLNSRALGLGQAAENAANGMAITQIADGALGQISDNIQTIRTKAMEAAGPGQTAETRQAIQADIDAALSTINDIARQTSYNGQSLLSGAFANKQFPAVPDGSDTVTISIEDMSSSQLGTGREYGTLADIDVATIEGAQAAVNIADQALEQVNQTRSNVGALQNRFQSSIDNLSNTRVNLQAAQSQIEDVDLAEESINLNRLKLLEKANAFSLAQSNISQERVVNLLQ